MLLTVVCSPVEPRLCDSTLWWGGVVLPKATNAHYCTTATLGCINFRPSSVGDCLLKVSKFLPTESWGEKAYVLLPLEGTVLSIWSTTFDNWNTKNSCSNVYKTELTQVGRWRLSLDLILKLVRDQCLVFSVSSQNLYSNYLVHSRGGTILFGHNLIYITTLNNCDSISISIWQNQ